MFVRIFPSGKGYAYLQMAYSSQSEKKKDHHILNKGTEEIREKENRIEGILKVGRKWIVNTESFSNRFTSSVGTKS